MSARRGLFPQPLDFLNIHALGGGPMIAAATEAALDEASRLGVPPPGVLAVTLLTSVDQQALTADLGLSGTLDKQVVRLARLAQANGAAGVVASIRELKAIRSACGNEFFIATPGVRPGGYGVADDQRRVGTPAEAVRLGSSAIIVGRPITEATDRSKAARAVLAELRNAGRK